MSNRGRKQVGRLQRVLDREQVDTTPIVNEFAAAQGDYRQLGKFGDARHAMINRGGSAIERWLNEDGSVAFNDGAKAAVRYCQSLWQRIDRKGPPDLSGIRVPGNGQGEHDALAALASMKKRFPTKYWDCFENVCRFELDAVHSGRPMASNTRSASDAAKQCTAFVASMIAQWEGF